MCKCKITSYRCGHHTRHYTNCKTNAAMRDSSESPCGSTDFFPVVNELPCNEPWCHYSQCVSSWRCCRCKQGPNAWDLCRKDRNPRLSCEADICNHRLCDGCEPWKASLAIRSAKEGGKKTDDSQRREGVVKRDVKGTRRAIQRPLDMD